MIHVWEFYQNSIDSTQKNYPWISKAFLYVSKSDIMILIFFLLSQHSKFPLTFYGNSGQLIFDVRNSCMPFPRAFYYNNNDDNNNNAKQISSPTLSVPY